MQHVVMDGCGMRVSMGSGSVYRLLGWVYSKPAATHPRGDAL